MIFLFISIIFHQIISKEYLIDLTFIYTYTIDVRNVKLRRGDKMQILFESEIDLSIFQAYKINCEKCCGLCCVALFFSKSDGFPKDKESGVVCDNLQTDYECKKHSKLTQLGLKGCLAYDCFGAGQCITARLNTLPNWHSAHTSKEHEEIFQSFCIIMRIQQTLWYLSQCLCLRTSQSEKEQAKSLLHEGSTLIDKPFEVLENLHPQPFYKKANEYLKHIWELQKSNHPNMSNQSIKNYMGKQFQNKNLIGRDFSMALLIAANLEQASLYGANLLGADMRDTNICNTDLSQCLFLTQMQINTAKGNHNTILPPFLHKPKHWNNNA